ncbi:MAG: hypothetical protein IJJ60_02235, partial [Clostridia bacterium]|nr:hypothetical protein [Clostridia bacterium]
KNLGLEFQPAKAFTMKDPIPIPLEFRPERAGLHRPIPALCISAANSQRRKKSLFLPFQFFADGHTARLLPVACYIQHFRMQFLFLSSKISKDFQNMFNSITNLDCNQKA